MKPRISAILLVLVFMLMQNTQAQQPMSAAESAEKLRAQLLEVQSKEEALRVRAQQLDEALKPENIERSLAGIGSTRPEELREARRRQLQIERDSIASQLKLLEASRVRLERAILEADARAYQQSARPTPPSDETQANDEASASNGTRPTNEMLATQSPWGTRLLVSGTAAFAVIGLLTGLVLRRRLRK